MPLITLFLGTMILCFTSFASAEDSAVVLAPELRHVRIEGPREWSEFPETPDANRIEATFSGAANDQEWTLQVRQQDVKQSWPVSLNGKKLDNLARDENDMVVYFPVPPGAVRDGENTLVIEHGARGAAAPDDVRIGQIVLHRRPRDEVLNEATLELEVIDADSGEPLPGRITIITADGALQSVGAESNAHLAVRPGVVFTSTGQARVGVPAGAYALFAGRGFEYSLSSAEVALAAGQSERVRLAIRREVPTEGYAACDTHVHTLTHSGHGDATVEERMVTLAAEGIELPIATDHNVQIDHEPFAREADVRQRFTPVVGNEVTTKVGHFNVFPAIAGGPKPDHTLTEWSEILDSIYATPRVKVAILNHARDLHSGVRPFGPSLFNDAVGENLDGWAMHFNAMEVVNSGATQTDPLRLFHDWMALLNRSRRVTPVGSSDSHDVARHFVGQGRTYIRCDDRDPGAIDVEQAVHNFLEGRVMVSYGLLCEIAVDGKYSSGEISPAPADEVTVAARVLAPHWVDASKVVLYANGNAIREETIDPEAARGLPAGVKWRGEWRIPRPSHDVFLTAIATGPGIEGLYWKAAKPYQPTSPDWTPQVIGCSGAVWIDADHDGRPTPAFDYAERMVLKAGYDFDALLESLAGYDRAVAAQAAHLWQSAHGSLLSEVYQAALSRANPETRSGFREYLEAWRRNQIARAGT
ncbi:MAG: CehA/McbA family metallohydrolase [Planctomycetes bacterium]|nr:CehA/McbA family metallohydrolase [Planctomycetota bacterium]